MSGKRGVGVGVVVGVEVGAGVGVGSGPGSGPGPGPSRGPSFKNDVLGLVSILALALTLKQHSGFKKQVDPDPNQTHVYVQE